MSGLVNLKQILPARWQVGRWLRQHDLTRPDPGRFRILLADLAGDDPERSHSSHLANALAEQSGLAVLQIGAGPAVTDANGRERSEVDSAAAGRELLAAHDGDVLIYGTLTRATPRMRLRFLGRYEGVAGRHGAYQMDTAELPKRFGPDFEGQLLALVAVAAAPASFSQDSKTSLVELLRPAAGKLTRLLEQPPSSMESEQLGALWHALGLAACLLGEQNDDSRWLAVAIHAHRTALQVWRRDAVLFDWAMTQNNLGHALRLQAAHESRRSAALGLLAQAGEAFERALYVFRAATAHDFISHTEANLARVEVAMSERQLAAE